VATPGGTWRHCCQLTTLTRWVHSSQPVADLADLPEVLTLNEARRLARVGRTRAYELAKTGDFPGQLPSIGRSYRVSRARLIDFIANASPEDGAA
jgi:hypothetical protein